MLEDSSTFQLTEGDADRELGSASGNGAGGGWDLCECVHASSGRLKSKARGHLEEEKKYALLEPNARWKWMEL